MILINQDISQAIQMHKSYGFKITPQRIAIYNYLIKTKTHLTADEIFKAIKGYFPSLSIATVYNNLNCFKQVGLIKELKFGDGFSRFDANLSDHYHVICNNCGKIEDFLCPNQKNIESLAASTTSFKVENHYIELYGLCKECQ